MKSLKQNSSAWILCACLFLGNSAPAVTFITQPQSTTVPLGDRAVFTALATGTGPLTYQWQKNGNPISGATSSLLILHPVVSSDAGNYTVAVSDSTPDTHTSAPANLAITLPKAGDVDPAFADGVGIDGSVAAMVEQSDGRILIGGNFTSVNGAKRIGIARLNSDGTTDYSFGNGLTGTRGDYGNSVLALKLLSDGKVLIAGLFTNVNGIACGRVARLHSDGTVDISFANGLAGTDYDVYGMAVQSDGKILIAGGFSTVNGIPRSYLARLHSDGTLDTSFGFGAGLTGPNNYVRSLAVQSDGKVLIGGDFVTVNDLPYAGIARLNIDGTLDTTFANGPASLEFGAAYSMAVQSDDRVLLAGAGFSAFDGTTRAGIARLNRDGTLDPTFGDGQSGTDDFVTALALQSNGKLLIGGWFTTVNGIARSRIARLNSDGTLDSGFGDSLMKLSGDISALAVRTNGQVLVGGGIVAINNNPVGSGVVRLNPSGTLDMGFSSDYAGAPWGVSALALQDDGKVLVAGATLYLSETSPTRVARLNSDGTLDTSFGHGLTGADEFVAGLALQSDGKILIAGSFTNVNGVARNRIARLNSNGTLDSTFSDGLAGADGSVTALASQSDGKVLIGGYFTSVNGTQRKGIARLNGDGSLDTGFANEQSGLNPGPVYSIAVQPDGKVVLGGSSLYVNGAHGFGRLNTDGTLDPGFANGQFGANDNVFAVALQSDGKVLIGGAFVNVNGAERRGIARLNSNGTLDASFGQTMVSGSYFAVRAVVVQPDGKIVIAGDFNAVNGTPRGGIARLNSDGTLDTSFGNSQSGIPGVPYDVVWATVLQGDGKVIVGGNFSNVGGRARNFVARLYGQDTVVLSVARLADQLALFWPTNTGNWLIQSSPTLHPAAWADLVPQPALEPVGSDHRALLQIASTNAFFRLRK